MHSATKFVSSLARCLRGSSRVVSQMPTRMCSTVIASPTFEGESRKYPDKIHKMVEDISQLTLIEIADLNELLKKTLRITDAPIMQVANVAGNAVAEEVVEEVEEEPVCAKVAFTVRILGYGEKTQKLNIIKHLRKIYPEITLADAKRLLEELPSVLRTDAPKEESDQLKTDLEALGANVEVS